MITLVTASRYATAETHSEIMRSWLVWASHARAGDVNPDWELWEGCARGGDDIAYDLAKNDFRWQTRRFPANWQDCDPAWVDPLDKYKPCEPDHRKLRSNGTTLYCPTAGFRRNQLMVDTLVATAARKVCVAFPIPELGSAGTEDCLLRAIRAGLPTITAPLRAPAGSLPGKEK